MRTCDVCGSVVTGRSNRLRCAGECSRLAARSRAKDSNLRAKADGRYEARKQKQREGRLVGVPKPPSKTCRYCAGPARRLVCNTPECRKTFQRDRVREQQRRYRAEARARGESFTYKNLSPEKKAARLASLAEYAKTPRGKQRHRELREANAARRRAQKLGVDCEKFRHVEVFERDGWICGLCGVPVDCDQTYPHPDSPSLDHVLPLSHGGPHTRDNTQLAHLGCNFAKGNRIEFEGGVAA